jgi:O-antigen/teichoic acid export membrane protein
MIRKISEILRTKTFQQSIITVVATFATAGLGAVFYLLLARLIGANDYGLFSISVSILTLLVGVVDLGMAQGLVRFVSENSNDLKYLAYAKIALKTKFIVGLSVWAVLWVFAGPISQLIGHPEIKVLLPVVGLGIISMILFALAIYIFQGLQKFLLWGGLQISGNIFRLILLSLLFLWVKIDPTWGLLLFISAPLFGFIISWFWLPTKIFSAIVTKEQHSQFWNFNKWTAAFTIVSVLTSRIDILLTARFLSLSETGVYSLSTIMVAFLPQLSSAFGAVTAPKLASFSDAKHSREYVSKATLFSLGISIVVGLFMIPAALFVIWFTGKDFSQALIPFLILLIALLIFNSLNPVRDSILYYYKLPKFFFWAGLMQATALILASIILIPIWGVVGTALSVLIGQIILSVVCLWKYEDCRTLTS